LAVAVELDAPVSPVFVAEDWVVTSPELPEMADGVASTSTEPPSPPLADTSVMESPPWTPPRWTRSPIPRTVWRFRALPPRPARAAPPSPASSPSPPKARPCTLLWATPVVPELATALEAAPDVAEDLA